MKLCKSIEKTFSLFIMLMLFFYPRFFKHFFVKILINQITVGNFLKTKPFLCKSFYFLLNFSFTMERKIKKTSKRSANMCLFNIQKQNKGLFINKRNCFKRCALLCLIKRFIYRFNVLKRYKSI